MNAIDAIVYSLISSNVPYTTVQDVQDELGSLVKNMSNYDQTPVPMTSASQLDEASNYDRYYDYYDHNPISSDTTTMNYKPDAQYHEMILRPYWCYESNSLVPTEQPIVPSNYPVNGKQKTRVSCTESLSDLLNGFRISFDGNHNDMTQSWSQEEYKVRRRVVQFFKNGERKRIKAIFKAIDPIERPKNGIFVSCVYWYDKITQCDKWYFTSTDYLNLFESLTGIRLTSDEKNRIRRNLEEYKPITVGKNKNNSDEIYKDLMAYSFAKPRNAEKDIKIYEWKYLIHAIEKMINKYSGRVHAVRIEERAEAGTSRLDDNGGTISFPHKRNGRVTNRE